MSLFSDQRGLEASRFPRQAVRRKDHAALKVTAQMQTNSTAAPDLLTVGTAAGCGFASEILRDQLKVPERRLTFRTGRLERSFEAVADVIVNQCLLGALDGALHGLKLLGDLSARPPLLDHSDDRFEGTIGAV